MTCSLDPQPRVTVVTRAARRGVLVGLLIAAGLVPACIDLSVNLPETLFGGGGSSFVVSGRAAVASGSCPVWIGDNGVTYHLFQDPRVANEAFDAITTQGTRSRLELSIRTDLEIDCRVGPTAEVQNVLEIEQ